MTSVSSGMLRHRTETAHRSSTPSILVAMRFWSELPPESCDVVWANGALHHIENLEFAVEQIFRALRPGGRFVAECAREAGAHGLLVPSTKEGSNLVLFTWRDQDISAEGEPQQVYF